MSDASTKHLIDMYLEQAPAPMFLSTFFKTPPRNLHTSEKIEIDIQRDDEDVAVVIHDLSVGPRKNEASLYTSKAFTPPVFDEEGVIRAYNMIKRMAGENPFADPQFQANAAMQAGSVFAKLVAKIRRAIELMASQVLQTGVLTLRDQDGTAVFSIDFQAKSEHFPTVVTPWHIAGSAGTPLTDLSNLADIVRRNGKKIPNTLLFGKGAWQRFKINAQVLAELDKLNIHPGEIRPSVAREGASFRGKMWIDHYEYELWMYDGFCRLPGQADHTPYIDDDKVIMLSTEGRLDLTYGAIPSFVRPEERVVSILPPTIFSEAAGLHLTTNSYVTQDGKSLMVGAGTRPLTIPTAIDTFGCLEAF